MKKSPRTRGFLWLHFGILMICLPGCQGRQEEIPISTYSKEAREIFREAREKYEFHHTQQADKLLTAALEKDPLFAQAHIYKAFTASASDEIERAITKAAANAERTTEAEQILIAAIRAFRWENNPEKAIQHYRRLIDLYPADARARWLLARVYIKIKETTKAIELLERSVETDPDFAPACQDLGYRNMIRGNHKKAEEYFQRYLELVPDEPNSHDCIADLYTKTGRFKEAIVHYRKALFLDPDFAISERNIGISLCFMGKYEEGRSVLQKAAAKEKNPFAKVITMEKIIHSYLYEEKYLKALEAADEVIRMALAEGVLEEAALYQLAKCAICCEIGDFDQAGIGIAECRKMFRNASLAPYYKKYYEGECVFWEAWLAAKRGRFTEALDKAEEFRAVCESRKDFSRVKYHTALLGFIALEQGKPRWAFELFKNADIEDPFFIYYTAVAKDKAGDLTEAAKYFRKAGNWNSDGLWYALIREKALNRRTS